MRVSGWFVVASFSVVVGGCSESGAYPSGGANNAGTIFRITSSGAFTVLYTFGGGADGGRPYATLMQASDGKL